MIVISEYQFKNLSIHEVTSTIEIIQHKHIDKYGFNDSYKVNVICHTEYVDGLKNKTKNVIFMDYYLICRAKSKDIASHGRYRMNRFKKLIVIIQGEINKICYKHLPKNADTNALEKILYQNC